MSSRAQSAHVLMFVDILKQEIKNNDTSTSTVLSRIEFPILRRFGSKALLVTSNKFEEAIQPFWSILWSLEMQWENTDILYATNHPILLPKGHHLTTMIILRAHERDLHNGTKETLTEVCSSYWIMKGRSVVKIIVPSAVSLRVNIVSLPTPPPLPKFRVREEFPFTYTGVDFAGPFYVKTSGTTSGSKVWLCLYTCCIVSAVHLDIVPTESFFQSFKRSQRIA